MADKTYVVTALAALVNVDGGYASLIQQGGTVPSNVDPVQLEHMLENGIVEEGELTGGLASVLSGDGQTVLTKPVDPDVKPEPDDVDGDGPIPPKSADKATWVAYAVSKGATQDEADGSTKDDLIAAYGAA